MRCGGKVYKWINDSSFLLSDAAGRQLSGIEVDRLGGFGSSSYKSSQLQNTYEL